MKQQPQIPVPVKSDFLSHVVSAIRFNHVNAALTPRAEVKVKDDRVRSMQRVTRY